jgi:hypothetical protein
VLPTLALDRADTGVHPYRVLGANRVLDATLDRVLSADRAMVAVLMRLHNSCGKLIVVSSSRCPKRRRFFELPETVSPHCGKPQIYGR